MYAIFQKVVRGVPDDPRRRTLWSRRRSLIVEPNDAAMGGWTIQKSDNDQLLRLWCRVGLEVASEPIGGGCFVPIAGGDR